MILPIWKKYCAATISLLWMYAQFTFSQTYVLPQQQIADDEILVNEISGAAAGSRSIIIPFGASSIVLIWEDTRNAATLYQHTIYAQRLNFPAKYGKNILLTPIDGFAVRPEASFTPTSKQIVLTWQEYTSSLIYSNICARKIDSTCSNLQKIIIASRDSLSYPVSPHIAVNDSVHVLLWQQSVEKQNVMFRSFDKNLFPRSDTMRQNIDADLSALLPVVAMTSDGYVQSAWIDKGYVKRSIMTQRNLCDGKHIRSNVRLSDFDTDLQISQPDIISLPDDQTLCVWTDGRGGKWNVYAQFIDQDGLKLGNNLLISTSLPVEILADVALGVNAKGNIFIAWESKRNKNFTIAGQWITSDGKFIGKNFYLLTEGNYDSRKPAVRCERDAAYLSWLDNRYTDSPSMFDVFVKRIDDPTPTHVERRSKTPDSFILGQNYPNPFTSSTTVRISTPIGTLHATSLRIYDVFGREVLDLSNKIIDNGQLTIDNSQLPSQGIYFYRFTAGNESQTKVMILLK